MANKNNTAKHPDFEKALTELEAIVRKMEGGDLSLDETLKEFEGGVALVRQCQKTLQDAHLRVEHLLTDNDAPVGDS